MSVDHSSVAPIAEQIVSAEEYNLLTRVLAAAEQRITVAVSCFLAPHPECTWHPTAVADPPLVVTLLPRPRFPPALLKDLLPHSLRPPSIRRPVPAPHSPVYFHPSRLSVARQICALHGASLEFPDSLAATAANVAQRVLAPPPDTVIAETLHASLWPKLLPFQRDGVFRAIRATGGRVLFADDMGLGKTLQALAVADYFNRTSSQSSPTLVLCPATLRISWARAIIKWLPSATRLSVHTVTSSAHLARLLTPPSALLDPWDAPPSVSHIVCAYDLLPRLVVDEHHRNFVRPGAFRIIIADECHLLRNASTARTRAALPLLMGADVRILVSGTPALSRPSDVYPLLCALLHDPENPFLSLTQFAERYGMYFNTLGSSTTNPAARMHEINALLSAVMVRRSKKDVNINLPPKSRVRVLVQLLPHQLQPFIDMQNEIVKVQEFLNNPHDPNSDATMRARREALYSIMYSKTANAKLRAVLTRIHQLLCETNTDDERSVGRKSKILVFAHHKRILDALAVFIAARNVPSVRIDGKTPCAERERLVDMFQSSPLIRVALLSLNVASTGVTLTAADTVLFAEICWVPANLAQAEDRAHRIGRIGPVTVEYIVAPGTLDDAMMIALQGKSGRLYKTVDGDAYNNRLEEDVVSACSHSLELSEVDIQTVISDSIIRAGQTCQDDMCAIDDILKGAYQDSDYRHELQDLLTQQH